MRIAKEMVVVTPARTASGMVKNMMKGKMMMYEALRRAMMGFLTDLAIGREW